MNLRLCAMTLCLAQAGCAQLPDLDLAKQARMGGDLQVAEDNYRPLAEMGYTDAQVGLADVLVQSPDPARQAEGEAIYRASAQTNPDARIKLGKWLASKESITQAERLEASQLLRDALNSGDQSALLALVRLQLEDPTRVGTTDIERELRDWEARGIPHAGLGWVMVYRARGDYAAHVDEIRKSCEAWLSEVNDCYVELATVYRIQGDDEAMDTLLGRLQSAFSADQVPPTQVRTVARALVEPGPGEPRPEDAKRLYESIAPQWPDAYAGLADLLRNYPQLGDSDQVVAYLEQGVQAGSSRSALLLGQIYMNGKLIPAEPEKAEQYFLQAAPQESKARLLLARLYRDGMLGEVHAEKALEQLLIVARSGNPSGDVALAQLYGDGRGIKIEPVYAYGFATLAKEQGVAQADVWLERMAPRLQPGDMERVRTMVSRERAARTGEQISLGQQNYQAQDML